MNTIDLKSEVSAAIKSEWADFERNHPRLAGAIDRDLLIEHVADSLADDPAYQKVMTDAQATGTVIDMVLKFVRDTVRRVLRV